MGLRTIAAALACLARFAIAKRVRLVGVRLSGLVPVDEKHRRRVSA